MEADSEKSEQTGTNAQADLSLRWVLKSDDTSNEK